MVVHAQQVSFKDFSVRLLGVVLCNIVATDQTGQHTHVMVVGSHRCRRWNSVCCVFTPAYSVSCVGALPIVSVSPTWAKPHGEQVCKELWTRIKIAHVHTVS